MKSLLLLLFCIPLITISCRTNTDPEKRLRTENFNLRKENDSLKKMISTYRETRKSIKQTDSIITSNKFLGTEGKAGVHPITLQWIGWDHPGEATLTPIENGWYSISGSQSNSDGEYLRINGKIRRILEKELEFVGKIETFVKFNNAKKPCVKEGRFRFLASGTRKYFRLQDMENCEGGRVVDYVDIFVGTSGL